MFAPYVVVCYYICQPEIVWCSKNKIKTMETEVKKTKKSDQLGCSLNKQSSWLKSLLLVSPYLVGGTSFCGSSSVCFPSWPVLHKWMPQVVVSNWERYRVSSQYKPDLVVRKNPAISINSLGSASMHKSQLVHWHLCGTISYRRFKRFYAPDGLHPSPEDTLQVGVQILLWRSQPIERLVYNEGVSCSSTKVLGSLLDAYLFLSCGLLIVKAFFQYYYY